MAFVFNFVNFVTASVTKLWENDYRYLHKTMKIERRWHGYHTCSFWAKVRRNPHQWEDKIS